MDYRRRRALSGLAVLATVSLAGCGGPVSRPQRASSTTVISAATGHASIGALTITGGYIPQPASPDVAAAYLTITNAGGTADTVTKVSTNVTEAVMAMNETTQGGVGTMTGLGAVSIPAHGSISLTPGRAHLMLENPTSRLRVGQQVSVTITFAHAGTITLAVPVVPLTGPLTGPVTGPSRSPMASPGDELVQPASSCPALTSPWPGRCRTSQPGSGWVSAA
jgi:copper(I)-binding protein